MNDFAVFSLLLLGIIIVILILAGRRCDVLAERVDVAEARLSLSRMGVSTLLGEIEYVGKKLKRAEGELADLQEVEGGGRRYGAGLGIRDDLPF
ncbi:hypothetical protein LCGC14_1221060 [marine sediment metagenome]|uniref:Uncharacterized protein n=1 Tax=marine sediment metagenome TaxID=412755 RepID=A0A0F9PFS5_9ZZZZ